MKYFKTNQGFSIVEVIVAAAIFVTAVTVFVVSFAFLSDLAERTTDQTQAALLLEEGAEAVLLFRDLGWEDHIDIFDPDTAYFLFWNGSSYIASESEVAINDRYHRTVTFFEVERDGAGALTESGSEDQNTRRVLIEVSLAANDEVLASAEMLVHNSYEE
jgi:type II secretory pathway pseudopilin PulG